jgi:hypothetical protein
MGWRTLGRLNGKYMAAAKHVVGLSSKSSNWTVMRDRLQSGIGSDPLQLTYITAVLKEVKTLHTSTEDLGFMWRGLRGAHEKGMASTSLIPHFDKLREGYPVLNVMAQMRELDITIGPPAPSSQADISSAENTIYALARALNQAGVRNTSGISPLLEAGLTHSHQVLDGAGKRVLTLTELKLKFPRLINLNHSHARALRSLSSMLQAHPEVALPAPPAGPIRNTARPTQGRDAGPWEMPM